MIKQRIIFSLCCLALLLGGISTQAFANKSDDTLRWASDKELADLDYFYDSTREGIIISRLVWDSLVYRDPKTFEYEPLLATSWNWVDDTTLDMTLRKGVKFQNGEPFGADDVVFTLNYVVDPENRVLRKSNVDWIKSAEKLGDYKVRIHLKKPFPAAMEYLAGPIVIYPKEYYSKVGKKGMNHHPIGTGPYKVTKVEPGKEISFEINPNYFKGGPKGQPHIKNIVFEMIPEKGTQMARFMSGGLDWIWQVPTDQAEKLKTLPNVTVEAGGTFRIGFITMDAAGRTGEDNPFTKQKVRQAVAYAINRKAMVENLVKGVSTVVDTACFPTQHGCSDDGVTHYNYDPDKAKKLLAEAGYPDGFTTELYAYRDRPFAVAIVSYLKAIGINAKLRFLSYPAFNDKYLKGKTPMAFYTWGSEGVNDVSGITSYFFVGNRQDYSHDDKVTQWLHTGDTTVDQDKRDEAYSEALQRISQQAYWAPLFSYSVNYAFDKDLDFHPTKDGIPEFYKAKWK